MSIKTYLRKIVHIFRHVYSSLAIDQVRYSLRKPFCHQVVHREYGDAREQLEKYSPKPDGSSRTDNRLAEPFAYDLQIVIPAYNSEKYLIDALESVVNQKTTYKYCVFLIDDGSNDHTYEICETYKTRNNFFVIHQRNGGFSDARNHGLKTILGKYVMFVDSDDLLVDGAIQALLDVAFQKDADVVQGCSYELFEGQKNVRNRCSAIASVDAERVLEGMAWAKVYRSSLFQDICFPKSFWFEDTITKFLLYPLCKNAYVIPDMVYVYRMNQLSISHTFSKKKKAVDTIWITEEVFKERKRRQIPDSDNFQFNLHLQIIINYKRLAKLPLDVQQNAFIVEREMLLAESSFKGVGEELYSSIVNMDFGAFRNYCRFHK